MSKALSVDLRVRVVPAIESRFGPRSADIVRGCTHAVVVPKPQWRARKEAYIARLDSAAPDVLLVS